MQVQDKQHNTTTTFADDKTDVSGMGVSSPGPSTLKRKAEDSLDRDDGKKVKSDSSLTLKR